MEVNTYMIVHMNNTPINVLTMYNILRGISCARISGGVFVLSVFVMLRNLGKDAGGEAVVGLEYSRVAL